MTRPVYIKFETIKDRVEMAHARGWDTNRIVLELGVPPKTVKAVIDAMEKANGSEPPSYCRNGHERTKTNTSKRPDGRRECRECATIAKRVLRDKSA